MMNDRLTLIVVSASAGFAAGWVACIMYMFVRLLVQL